MLGNRARVGRKMEEYLNENFVANNPKEKVLRRWRSGFTVIKNRRRRFRMVAEAIEQKLKIEVLKIKQLASNRQCDHTQPLVGCHEAVIAIETSRTQEETDPAASAGNDDNAQSMDGSLEVEMAIEPRSNVDHGTQDKRNGWTQKVSLEWMFVIINFMLELPSAVLDQLSSEHKPRYALFAMLISFATLLMCIVEVIYKGRKERVHWKWRGMLPWFYYPQQNHKRFGSFKDIFASVCALCQCVFTAINYSQSDQPIKITVWPVVFAFGLLFSKILENPERRAIPER